jgi:hypothetical protein
MGRLNMQKLIQNLMVLVKGSVLLLLFLFFLKCIYFILIIGFISYNSNFEAENAIKHLNGI